MAEASLRKLGFDLQALEMFIAVCRTGSMTTAARELGVTQPAVSRAVALLEEKLDVALFKREARPLVATLAGQRLRDAAERLTIEALALPGIVRGRDRRKLPQVRLGVLDSLSDPFVPLILKDFREISNSVTVVTGFDDFLRQAMLRSELDAVISTSAFDEMAAFEQFELFNENYIVVAPRNAASFVDENSFKLFAASLPLIRLGNTSSMAQSVERHLRRMRLNIPEALSCNTVESVMGMVAAGAGWSILTPVCVRKCLHNIAQLRLQPVPGQQFLRHVYFATRKNELEPFTARAVGACRTVISEAYLPVLRTTAGFMEQAIRLSPDL